MHAKVLNTVNYSVDGEENKNFNRKPSKNPRRPTKKAKLREKPGSPLWFLRLLSMSYTIKRTNGLVVLVCNSSKVSTINIYARCITQLI
jgi:hypothetical protein